MRKEFSPRMINVLLGGWLLISSFLWEHSSAQVTNSWLVGVAAVIVAAIAASVDGARYLNVLLAIWLFIAAFALPHASIGTVVNDIVVAVAMLAMSLLPSRRAAAPEPRRVPTR